MPSAVHHIQLLTRNRDTIVEFLEGSLGLVRQADMNVPLADVADLLGFDTSDGHIRSALLGSGDRGLVEVIEWPHALPYIGGRLNFAGTAQLAFAVDDLDRCLAAARRLGASHVVGPKTIAMSNHDFSITTFKLDGVRFQLTAQSARRACPSRGEPTTAATGRGLNE
jgi:catechol 2,3-dioxygenase-like lactoylglutathione lyase family enzyme